MYLFKDILWFINLFNNLSDDIDVEGMEGIREELITFNISQFRPDFICANKKLKY